MKSMFPRLSFLTKKRKNKKEEKMIRLEPRLMYTHSVAISHFHTKNLQKLTLGVIESDYVS